MKVFMLGWEFPPHISGGLGTACQGLTEGLARQGADVEFVVPHLFGGEPAGHMRIHAADAIRMPDLPPAGPETAATLVAPPRSASQLAAELASVAATGTVRTRAVQSLLHPYLSAENYETLITELLALRRAGRTPELPAPAGEPATDVRTAGLPPALRDLLRNLPPARPGAHYGANLFEETARYAQAVLALGLDTPLDLIHAHDWMTYPAAILLQGATGRPLVLHVHSIEYDRSGEHGDARILAIEHAGLHAADRIIAVSHYTRGLVHDKYGVPLSKIEVVHNGVYPRIPSEARAARKWHSKVVLFLGRVTFQKGPDYFVEAAAKVVPHMPDVTFVMAGSGDMLPRMIERVAELGLEQNFHFTGFLRGAELETMFSVADLYVMPSVSEPFGISPLEALSFDVPVIISRQSGVAEVLQHALKTDFWDVDRLADLILAALRYPELREEINAQAREEIRRLRWDAAAQKTMAVYENVLASTK